MELSIKTVFITFIGLYLITVTSGIQDKELTCNGHLIKKYIFEIYMLSKLTFLYELKSETSTHDRRGPKSCFIAILATQVEE